MDRRKKTTFGQQFGLRKYLPDVQKITAISLGNVNIDNQELDIKAGH